MFETGSLFMFSFTFFTVHLLEILNDIFSWVLWIFSACSVETRNIEMTDWGQCAPKAVVIDFRSLSAVKKSYFPFGRIIWLGCLMASEECCSKFKLTLKKCFNQIFVVTICDQSCSVSCNSNVQFGTEKWATIVFWN